MVNKELVSIIIPCYNSEQFVSEAIDSVLDQSHKAFEIIVVDDGSTDNSLNVLKQYTNVDNVLILQHEGGVNKGVSSTRKLGVSKAKGKYIAFLDADDIFDSRKLEKQLKIFQKYPEVVLVHSKASLLNMTELVFQHQFSYWVKNQPYDYQQQGNWLISNHICNSSVLVKTDLLLKYDFSIKQAFQFEDWLLWSLLSDEGKFYFQDEELLEYRIHGASATSNLLNNQIKSHYSKMEYLFNFFTLAKSSEMKTSILSELKATMSELMKMYNPAFETEFSSHIHLVEASQEQVNLTIKTKLLEAENQRIRMEMKELHKVKKSKFYKMYIRLKKIVKR